MGLGLNTLARRGRCPRCGYELGGIDPAGPCPECGSTTEQRRALVERRRQRRAWLHSYWAMAALAALPFVPLLLNLAAGIIHFRSLPWSANWHHAQSGPFMPLDVTAWLTVLGFLASVLLWPFLVVMLAYTVWSRWCDRHTRTTAWWVWPLMLAPLATPFVLWWSMGALLAFSG